MRRRRDGIGLRRSGPDLSARNGGADVLERAIATPTSGYVFIAQLRDGLPDAVAHCLWFAYGPASTSCFVPIYAGATDLPHAWDNPANFTRIDREQPQWNFRLVHNLTNHVRYQDAMDDVKAVFAPAEARFLQLQPDLEKAALRTLETHGPERAEELLNAYARQATTRVGQAYRELADYLMLRYLVGDEAFAPPERPQIAAPEIPETP